MIRLRSAWLAVVLVGAAGLASLAREQAPPQTRQLNANGVSLSYVEQGAGTPVVFVHGAVGDLRFWEPQREAIGSKHRFIALTLRYHSPAPWPDEGKQYGPAAHATDLAAFMSGLNAGPVHLVGLSYGGLLAAVVTLEHPHLVRSLTLAEPALFSLLAETPEAKPVLDDWNKSIQPMFAALKSGDSIGATKLLVEVVNNAPPGGFDQEPEAVRQMLLDNARTLPLLFAAPPLTISCEKLRAVKVPTLVVGGAQTAKVFTSVNDAVVRCVPGSRLVVVPGARHTMSSQNPTAFNEALLKFLAQP